jgi:hypothetical protein
MARCGRLWTSRIRPNGAALHGPPRSKDRTLGRPGAAADRHCSMLNARAKLRRREASAHRRSVLSRSLGTSQGQQGIARVADESDGGWPSKRKDEDKISFGNRHAGVLCNMTRSAQLDLLAEGLPVTLRSAQGFWAGATQLVDHPREARVLEGFCEEECAKIMILMDLVRCPKKLASRRAGKLGAKRILVYFYGDGIESKSATFKNDLL